jgi:hypothetical protein
VVLQTVAKRVIAKISSTEKEETARLKDGKRFPSSAVLTLLGEGIVDIETPRPLCLAPVTVELVPNSPVGAGDELG